MKWGRIECYSRSKAKDRTSAKIKQDRVTWTSETASYVSPISSSSSSYIYICIFFIHTYIYLFTLFLLVLFTILFKSSCTRNSSWINLLQLFNTLLDQNCLLLHFTQQGDYDDLISDSDGSDQNSQRGM